MLCWVVADRIFMSSEDVDRVAAYTHARPRNHPGVDGVADGNVGAACSFGSHVALGGEAGEEVESRCVGCHQGALGNTLLNGLQVFSSRVQEEMDVCVDHSGHQSRVAEIDDFGA